MSRFVTIEPPREKTNVLHICENKDADQLLCNREADLLLCFHYLDSTIPLLPWYKTSSLEPSSVAVQPGLCQTWSESTLLVFSRCSSISLAHECGTFTRLWKVQSLFPPIHVGVCAWRWADTNDWCTNPKDRAACSLWLYKPGLFRTSSDRFRVISVHSLFGPWPFRLIIYYCCNSIQNLII